MTDPPTHSDLEDRLRSHYKVDAGRVRPRPLEFDEVLRLAERATDGTRQSRQHPVEGLVPMIVERQIETARRWPRRNLIAASAVAAAVVGIAVGGLVIVTRQDDPTREVAAATQPASVDAGPDDTRLDGLVTEEVEPGVERIISDGAGHDLDETHPTYRYDMEDVAVTPDGTVLLWSTYHETDRDVHPGGVGQGLLELQWTLGEPGMSEQPDILCKPADEEEGLGVICVDTPEGVETTYLAGTPINEVVVAPDGTIWAVGDYDGPGGLYRITHERLTTN